ncbi:hypothetical protein GOODEAATRI_010951 [Goodea atripinnis]|uniref:Uncharacterized protein n=1 Tax=Goodea atripinnis TaxID=208336 RepID=A0ABV0NJI9_9TELE
MYMHGFRAVTELEGRQVSSAAAGATCLQALSTHPLPVCEKCNRCCLSDLHAAVYIWNMQMKPCELTLKSHLHMLQIYQLHRKSDVDIVSTYYKRNLLDHNNVFKIFFT